MAKNGIYYRRNRPALDEGGIIRMPRSNRSAARKRRARAEEAEAELGALYDALRDACALFNRTNDPALTEACILQIAALRTRCGIQLRVLKALEADLQGGNRFAASDPECCKNNSVLRQL